MTGTLTSKVCGVDFITNKHAELDNGVNLRLNNKLRVVMEDPRLTELCGRGFCEERHRGWSGHLDDGDTLEVTEEQDQMSAVHWLDGGREP